MDLSLSHVGERQLAVFLKYAVRPALTVCVQFEVSCKVSIVNIYIIYVYTYIHIYMPNTYIFMQRFINGDGHSNMIYSWELVEGNN